jgi:gliding motility-associated-like protein
MALKNILLILFLLISTASFAQKEANIWYFGKRAGLDFNYDPPRVLLNGALGSHEGSAIMADANGKLLFYTNGETVWNREHNVMENGTELGGHNSARQSSVIVPIPGKDGLYYTFTMGAREKGLENGLMYAVVDIKANNGLGKVSEKRVQLHAPGSESLSVVGSCQDDEDQEYWLLAGNIESPEKLFSYKIDKEGINRQAIVSSFSVKERISYIKFSPVGNKVVLIEEDWEEPQVIIGDFDFSSGEISNPNYIPVANTAHFNQAEFSPNGKYLYVSSGSKILQIDLLSSDYPVISSIETNKSILGELQLGPDGNLYIAQAFGQNLSVIKNPNLPGLEGKYYESYIDLKGGETGLGLPNFVRSYFYNGLTPDAGEDSLVCSGQSLQLGQAQENGVVYQWYPSTHLDKTDIANPVFQFHNTTDAIREFEYILTASDEHCAKKDTVMVQVYPASAEHIKGSRSVCPGVVEVEYSVPSKESWQNYQWEVEGGEIAAGHGSARILVNWGPTNPDARVRLNITNESACQAKELELPVRINVELDTETPQGPEEVCLNHRNDILYEVTNTNGSVYTWSISGGRITAGQGSHQVWVDWEGAGVHQLWLQEKSVTIDTICYGTSDVLDVLVYKDTTEIALDYVSISLEDDKLAEIQGNPELGAVASGDFVLYRQEWGQDAWQEVGKAGRDNIIFSDAQLSSDAVSYEYRMTSRNPCGEEIASLPHRTIVLLGEAMEEDDEVLLQWNAYQGWQQGVEKYEIWRKVDEEEKYQLIGETGPKNLQFTDDNSRDGFQHYFRIRALENNSGHASWSNELSLNFKHEISIPNVFTPNGDEYNQRFEIAKLEMYPENELTIFNRWGNIVYHKKGYQGEWDGGNVSPGVYFYSLRLNSSSSPYRGWVQIIRKNVWSGKE